MMKKASHYNVFQRPVVFSKPMSFRNSLQATLDFCAQYTLSLHLWMSFNILFNAFMFTFSAALKSDQKWLVCDNNKTWHKSFSRKNALNVPVVVISFILIA